MFLVVKCRAATMNGEELFLLFNHSVCVWKGVKAGPKSAAVPLESAASLECLLQR